MQVKSLIHANFITRILFKEFIISMTVLSIIQAFFLSLMLPSIAISLRPYSYHIHFSPSPKLLAPVISITSYIYGIIAVIAAAQIASEIERGDAALYLSFPISRLSYIFSWIIAALVLPSVMYFLSLSIPLLIIEPKLLFGIGGEELLLIVLQVSTSAIISFLAAIILKRRAFALAVGMFEYIILPFIFTFIIALLSSYLSYTGQSFTSNGIWWFAILYPYNCYLFFGYLGVKWFEAACVNIPFLLFILAFLIIYTKRYFEAG